MGLLDGRTALITGAARGQGRAHAVTCAREGADVVLLDLAAQIDSVGYEMARGEDLAATADLVEAQGRRALVVVGDVREQADLDLAVARAVDELGGLDILVANAGIWTCAPFHELGEQAWGDMIEVNLSGVWRAAKSVAPHMIERRSGSIVMISSGNGLEPGQTYAHYTAAKHGVVGLMKTVALELAPYGVRCNAVSPAAVRTPMTDHQDAWDMFAGHEGGTPDDMMDSGYHFHALAGDSFLDPQAIADTALYLNSSLAAHVTGVNVPVDAGHLLLTGFNFAPVKE